MPSLPRTKVIPEGLQRAIEGMKNLRRDDREDLASGCPVSVKPKRIIDVAAELKHIRHGRPEQRMSWYERLLKSWRGMGHSCPGKSSWPSDS